jgi:ABC-type multidrug transport system fused ATPase/permease subunit
MNYFDTTPVGRLMNRFTYGEFCFEHGAYLWPGESLSDSFILNITSSSIKDTETLDVTLTMNMTVLMTSVGWIITGILLMAIILPWMMIPIAFVCGVYWILVLHYRKSAVDLQRLDATSRSPVQAKLGEVIDGTSTIRTYGKSSHFSHLFRNALDENSGMMMNFMAAHRWLSVRIQLLGACTVLFSVSFVASFNDMLQISPGIAAILIIWSANFTIALSFFVQGISDSEAAMTSFERAVAMTEVPQEESKSLDLMPVDTTWPVKGEISFEKVSLRYRPGLPLSLNGLTFSLKSGQRCGVVGRTGAGKSTLAAALFRLVELEGGKITLDGVDLSTIQLADVRGRKNGMVIIPQEPVLFPGTLKKSLDPFGDYSDEEVMDALDAVRGASRGLSNLNTVVEEGGRNFSVGERQLICLGRAMLAKPKLLFLDEATASVDGETDALIQRMLRSKFVGTTLITIAHRLNTIMDYDCILVMSDGRAAEFGSPASLLSDADGIFSELVKSTGKESSAVLHSIAFGTQKF